RAIVDRRAARVRVRPGEHHTARTVLHHGAAARDAGPEDVEVAVEYERPVVVHRRTQVDILGTGRQIAGVVDLERAVLDHDEVRANERSMGQRELARTGLHQDGDVSRVLHGRKDRTTNGDV